MPTNEENKKITITITPEQYRFVHKIAQLQDQEDWQFVLECVRSQVDAVMRKSVQELLLIPDDEIQGFVDSFYDD